jgi:hypothetical protein
MKLLAQFATALSLLAIVGCKGPGNGAYYPAYAPTYSVAPSYSPQSAQPVAPAYGGYTAFNVLEGAKIIADDGKYLGKVTANAYDSDSIGNTYGNYGSAYSSTSIFNEYGEYGGQYSSKSPFNKYTTTPPRIITLTGQWAYLTVNEFISPRIDPFVVIGYVKR